MLQEVKLILNDMAKILEYSFSYPRQKCLGIYDAMCDKRINGKNKSKMWSEMTLKKSGSGKFQRNVVFLKFNHRRSKQACFCKNPRIC
jgi:hypothetical protein